MARRSIYRQWLSGLAAALTAGCLSVADPQGEPRDGVFRVKVVDSTGAPVPGSFLSLRTWPDNRGWSGYHRTDSLGFFVVDVTQLRAPGLDSVSFFARTPGCSGAARTASVVVGQRRLSAGHGDTNTVLLQVEAPFPPARTAPGEYCAMGYPSGFFGGLDVELGLRVDSLVGPLIYGRWETVYTSTRAGDNGAFIGGSGPTFAVLNLSVDNPWLDCTGFRLTVAVRPDGSWGTAAVTEPNGCDTVPMEFDFVEFDASLHY